MVLSTGDTDRLPNTYKVATAVRVVWKDAQARLTISTTPTGSARTILSFATRVAK